MAKGKKRGPWLILPTTFVEFRVCVCVCVCVFKTIGNGKLIGYNRAFEVTYLAQHLIDW